MRNKLVTIARLLRKNQTPHERTLWRLLRSRRFSGFKFRRQYPIGPYVADFCCPARKVIIELDGGQHTEVEQQRKDSAREQYLINEGYTVLRFWNNEIDQNLTAVADRIYKVLCE